MLTKLPQRCARFGLFTLVSCGSAQHSPIGEGAGSSGSSSGTVSGGAASSNSGGTSAGFLGGGAGANTRGGADASLGGASGTSPDATAGASEGGAPEQPDISGTWRMFVFQDRVAVRLVQNGSQLSGQGCDVEVPEGCGPIEGEIDGGSARFSFIWREGGDPYSYSARVDVAADGQRMAGAFMSTFQFQPVGPTAWLREPPEGFPSDPATYDPRHGVYIMTVLEASAGAAEYDKSGDYLLWYTDRGIASSVGSFHYTEIKRISSTDPIQAGPVSMAMSALACAMTLESEGASFTRALATTASGHRYTFALSRR